MPLASSPPPCPEWGQEQTAPGVFGCTSPWGEKPPLLLEAPGCVGAG